MLIGLVSEFTALHSIHFILLLPKLVMSVRFRESHIGHYLHSPRFFLCTVVIAAHIQLAASQVCSPTDCILSQWEEWTECSQSCGQSGLRARARQILAPEKCGGTCTGGTFESEPCNIRCCSENCEFSAWSSWSSCRCSNNSCGDPSSWNICVRYRDKIKNASCGGYCDNLVFQQQCVRPCCYKDCIMGAWAPWGECDARCDSSGFRVRNRLVIQESDCGGTPCEYESESTTCKGPCCPQDCVIGQWSDWSACSTVCGIGNTTRTRYIKYPVCGGANCTETVDRQSQLCENYVNIDCVMSPWSEWTECKLNNSLCGEGTKKRQRSVVTNGQCNGQPCPASEEIALCYGPCCVTDCKVGNWTDFGFCSTQCGEGKKNRTRPILVAQSCGGVACPDVIEFTSCTAQNATNCTLTEWTQWSACSTDCGKGKNLRTRTLLTPAYCGGQCQDMKTEDQRDCESYAARRDCQVNDWGPWGPCIRDCERGVQRSSRNITVVEACGGVPCTGKYNLTQTRTCHEKCTQLCSQGICSCYTGYILNASDGYNCSKRSCGSAPNIAYCGPGTVPFQSCKTVTVSCNGTRFGDRCNTSCSQTGWIVKGEPKYTECQADGTWKLPNIFCGPTNKAPLNISINTTDVSELLKVNQCFAKLTTITDNEAWDKHTYSVITDPLKVLKTINDTLCLMQVVDYETAVSKRWNATIRSTDLDGLFVNVNFTFTIINGNDPPRSAKLIPNTLPENSPRGTEIGCFELIDDDPGQTLTVYLLMNTNLFQLFMKNNLTCLRVLAESNVNCSTFGGKNCTFNYEVKSQITTLIGVKDDGVPFQYAYFDLVINITDVNEPITDITISPDSVPENITPGSPLLKFIAVDEDKVKLHKFELLNDPYGIFLIINDTLTASMAFDYEANPSIRYSIRVRGTDLIPPNSSVDVNVTFCVKDINEPPYLLQLTSNNALMTYPTNKPVVKENIPAVVIGTVSVLDPDKGDNITFSVSSDKFRITSAKCITISSNNTNYCTGKLVNLAGLNYEDTPFVVLKITAQDLLRLVIQLEVNITVINMDDPPKDILINGNVADSISVPENSKNFTAAVLETVDEDIDDLYNYFLSGALADQFRINGNILSTSASYNLDYETYVKSQLVITTVSTTRSGLSVTKTFNIIVTDVNEAPTKVVFYKTSIPENSPEGTLVSELSVVDPDTGQSEQQFFTYELLDDAQGRFYVKNGSLYAKASTQFCEQSTCQLDYESQSSLNIVVRVTDSGKPPLSLTVSQTISVMDVNDPPYNLQISASQIRENKPPGSIIGKFSFYIILSHSSSINPCTCSVESLVNQFSIDDHNNLIQLASLDYETQNVYFIGVQITDSGLPVNSVSSVRFDSGLPVNIVTNTIKIEVLNVNEAPVYLGSSVLSVKENAILGTEVGIISVMDPDNGDLVEITLKNFNIIFSLGNKEYVSKGAPGTNITVQLTTRITLDYETQPEYSLDISLVDKQGLETAVAFKIKVIDDNDPPQDIFLNNLPITTLTVQENVLSSLAVLTAVDQDVSQKFYFNVVSQPGENFVIIGNELKLSKALDYETISTFDITLEVTDSGTPPYKDQKVITINVLDVNEPPTDLKLTNNKVEENSVNGTVIGTFQVSDPDNKDGFTFSLLDSANGKFRIDGNQLLVVSPEQCTTNQKLCSLNFEEQMTYSVRVIVTDSGLPQESASFKLKIDVTDANDAPYNIILSGNRVSLLAAAGTVIGNLSVSDEDSSQTETFSLKDDAGGAFKVLDSNLVKATDAPFNTSKVYSVVVIAQDSGSPIKTTEQTFYINIFGNESPQNLNVVANNKSSQVNSETIGIPENSPVNIAIALISAESINPDQSISFVLLADENGQFQLDKNKSCHPGGSGLVCSTNLLLSKAVNFEKQERYSISFVATSTNNQQTSKSIAVQVNDVGEPPTVGLPLFNRSCAPLAPSIFVPENSQTVSLGMFTAVDEDKNDSHIFTLKNNIDNVFVISANGELSLAESAKLDYESKSFYDVVVVVSDSTKNIFEKVFRVNVVNINEPPSAVKLTQNTLSLKGAQCSISWCGLDFEVQKTHQLQLQVIDSGTPRMTSTLTFTVQVHDANDAPIFTGANLQLKENLKLGEAVTLLSATDPDVGQSLTYSLDSPSIYFKIDGNKLILTSLLDYETNTKIVVDVTVTDSGIPTAKATATFTFDILNVGEAPSSLALVNLNSAQSPVFPADQPLIGENTKPGALVGQFIILDPDFDEDVSVILTAGVLKAEKPACVTLTKQGTRCSASVTLNKALDFETQRNYSFVASVIDKYGLKLDKNFTLQVKDENDPPVNILINNDVGNSIKLKENSQGITVCNLGAIDPDIGQTFVFSVSGAAQFYIANNALKVSTAANIDYERTKTIPITLKVTDSGQPPFSLEKNVMVEVVDVNEAPVSLTLTRNRVTEDATAGVEVGSFITVDPDNSIELRQTFTYEWAVNPNNIFGIRNGSLVVALAQLDYEMSQSYMLKVKVTDSGSPPLSAQFDLDVQLINVNEPPTNLQLSAVGSQVGVLSAQDPDVGQTISFTITNSDFFTVNGNFLIVTGGLDFETAPRVTVEVTATDTGTPPNSVALNFTITITDANEQPILMNFTSAAMNLSVAEKTEINTVIGYIETYDPDSIDRISMELTDGSAKNFKLDIAGAICNVKVVASLLTPCTICTQKILLAQAVRYTVDSPPLILEVLAKDKGQLQIKNNWKITVLDSNDPPYVVTFWDVFSVNSTPVLFTLKALDYEQQSAYQLTLRCMDNGIPSANFTKTFTITVLDLNEQPNDIQLSNSDVSGQLPSNKTSVKISLNCSDNGVPSLYMVKDFDVFISNVTEVPTAIMLSGNRSVFENTVNVEVGKLSIINTLTETDVPGNYAYEVMSPDFFVIDGINSLIIKSPMNFENTSAIAVTVSVLGADAKGNSVDKHATFKIQVLDINEPPQRINIYGGGKVAENSAPGTIVGDLNSLDPELYQTFTYTLISVAIGLDANQSISELLNTFQIVGRTLKIGINNSALDYETARILSLLVQTEDSGTPPLSLNDTVRIILTNTNDPPTDITLNNTLIQELSSVGTLVGVFSVADQDVNQSHSCMVNNIDTVPFTVEGGLNLRVSRAEIDYESQKNYVVKVVCQDDGEDGSHLKVTKSLIINVTNVNEPPYDIRLSTYSINENNVIGQLVSEIEATDPDSQKVFFTLVDDSSSFQIDGKGSLVANIVFDYEVKSKYVMSVSATDENGLSNSSTFTIQVVDVNEKPTSVQLTQKVVSEAAPRGTIIASIVTQDPDRRQTFQYSLTEPPPSTNHFYIAGDKLLVGQTKLDFEFSSVYRISITSTDSGSPAQSLTVDFDIQVTDANEPPMGIIVLASPIMVAENTTVNTVLSEIQVTDQDMNQTHSCQTEDSGVPFAFVTSVGGTIQLVVSNVLDFEQQSVYQVNISCSDGEFSTSQMIKITVTDINEPPTAILLRGPHYLPATATAPYNVEKLEAEDGDVGQMHTFSTTGANSDILQVQRGNQLVMVAPIPTNVLDQPNPSISVVIHVADSGQPVLTFEQSLTLTITDIDIELLRLPEITINNTVISEAAAAGDQVGVIFDQNTAVASTVIFTIVTDASSMFAIKDNKFLVLSRNVSSFFGNSAQVTIQAKNSHTQQVKTRTVTIVISRTDKCYDNGKTCHENARCVQLNETTYQCRCNEDFDGDGFYCQQIDNCKVNVSRTCSQGKCIDGISSFQCYCDEGYSGVYCDVPPANIDPCQGNLCKNGAACRPTDNKKTYTCVCHPGWTGPHCDANIDDCWDAPCPSYQQCVDGVMSFYCTCPSDRTGQRCQFYKEACSHNACENTAVCVPKVQVDDYLCSSKENIVVLKINCATLNSTDMCKTQFLEFVQRNGQFPSKAVQPPNTVLTGRKKRSFPVNILDSVTQFITGLFSDRSDERVKRQSTYEDVTNVTVYVIDFKNVSQNIFEVSFVVLDANYVPYTVISTVDALGKTCISIGNSGQTEKISCSSIMETYYTYFTTTTASPSTVKLTTSSTTSKPALIAGPATSSTAGPVTSPKSPELYRIHRRVVFFIHNYNVLIIRRFIL
ncbi:hypothetical protein Btru_046779 [Bulinus truncatus]|nr:hypothetical protein Btru_046779 [Bulinus truncatus]